jgi:hypothetical protein
LHFEPLEDRRMLSVLGVHVNLYADAGGSPGALIADNTVRVGETFFVEVTAQDLRGVPAGIIGLSLDLGWNAAALEEIDSPFNPTGAGSPLLTTSLPITRTGTLDNPSGAITNLGGGSLPAFGLGSAIGAGAPSRFCLLHFRADAAVSNSPLTMQIGESGASTADALSLTPADISFDPAAITVIVTPELGVQNASVTTGEGQAAGNHGTWWSQPGDPISATLSASLGTVTKNTDGTWDWSYNSADNAGQPSSVTITADYAAPAGNTSTVTFALAVNNLPPALAAQSASVTTAEGQTVQNHGTWTDVAADRPNVTLAASLGTVTRNADGTWDWSYNAPVGGPASQTVTITASDGEAANSTASVGFALNVNNAPPTISVLDPSVAVSEGQAAQNHGLWVDTAVDPSQVTLTASVGTVVKNAGGTWDWSYTPGDSRPVSQTVTIAIDDGQPGGTASVGFALNVNNLPPALAVQDPTVTAGEGQTAQNHGTWSDVAGDLSFVTLSASVGSVTKNAGGTWDWSYTPGDDAPTAQNVTITADDGETGGTSNASFSLSVNNLPPVLTVQNQTATTGEGQAAQNHGTWTDVAADLANVALTASVGTVVKNADGTWDWSYTPAEDAGQPQTVTITADDGELASNVGSISFALAVNNLPPALAVQSASVATGEGQAVQNHGTWSDMAADRPNVTLTASLGTVVRNADGTWDWSYTPADDNPATSTVTITASDGESGGSDGISFSLLVNNLPPTVAVQDPAVTTNEGQAVQNHGTWSDVAADLANVTLTASAGTVTKNADGTWDWSFTPTVSSSTPQTVTITAADGGPGGTATATFSLTVNNLPPTIAVQSPSVTTGEGQAVQNHGTWSDVTADQANVTLTASIGAVTKNADGTWDWSYTPADNTPATSTVTITASDGEPGGTATATFSLTVNNLPPTIAVQSPSLTTGEGQAVQNHGTWSDVAADLANVTLTASVGTVTKNADGTWDWSFTPTVSSSTPQTVTITAADGGPGGTATDTFSLTVNNLPPTIAVQSPNVIGTKDQTAQNHGTWSDVATDRANVTLMASVGAVTKNADGTWDWSYTPSQDVTSAQTVTITANDGEAAGNTGSVTFQLVANPPPVLTNCSIAGFVYLDTNNDGRYLTSGNKHHAGIPGVTVTLTRTDAAGFAPRTTTTTADGSYRFNNLPPGKYSVAQLQPANFVDGKETLGTVAGQKVGKAANNRLYDIVLGSGQEAAGYNFGVKGLAPRHISLRLLLASSRSVPQLLSQIQATPAANSASGASSLISATSAPRKTRGLLASDLADLVFARLSSFAPRK